MVGEVLGVAPFGHRALCIERQPRNLGEGYGDGHERARYVDSKPTINHGAHSFRSPAHHAFMRKQCIVPPSPPLATREDGNKR